jgi:hypothetical protein
VLVAGIDVGNSTTGVAVARAEPGAEPKWLFVARCPTTGAKGSADCVRGIAELLLRAERRLGARPQLALVLAGGPARPYLEAPAAVARTFGRDAARIATRRPPRLG